MTDALITLPILRSPKPTSHASADWIAQPGARALAHDEDLDGDLHCHVWSPDATALDVYNFERGDWLCNRRHYSSCRVEPMYAELLDLFPVSTAELHKSRGSRTMR